MRWLLASLLLLTAACSSSRHLWEECDDAHPCDTGLTCIPRGPTTSGQGMCTKPCTAGCATLDPSIASTCYSGELAGPAGVPTPYCAIDCRGHSPAGAYCGGLGIPFLTSANLSADGSQCWCF